MTLSRKKCEDQKIFWEYAGRVGYSKAIFSDKLVERHIIEKQWRTAISVAEQMGLKSESKIIELGCGDGDFAENVISKRFKHIDAYDQSSSAIDRAKSGLRCDNISYHLADITSHLYDASASWDGAFMIGFLHHVKNGTHNIVSRLSHICPKVVVLEPNGDNMVRKFLELLPSYRKAGENSFCLKDLITIFENNGYKATVIHKINLTPPFLPKILLPLFEMIEKIVEPNSFLNRLCSTYVIGFQKQNGM